MKSIDLYIVLFLFTIPLLSKATLFQTSRMLFGEYVTKSGNVTIYLDDFNDFYIYADFDYHYDYASDSELDDPSLARMTLGLYTSQTILRSTTDTTSCLSFNNYNCTYYGCTPYLSSPSAPILPNFVVYDGYDADATVVVDYSNWELKTNATIATSCSFSGASYGAGSFGLIGLGLNGSQANFINTSSIFSIWLNQYHTKGTLLFSSNIDVTSVSTNVYIGALQASADWHVFSPDLQISVDNVLISSFNNISVIFDLNIIATGLPSQLFSTVIQGLEEKGGIYCESDNYRPTCSYEGKFKDLPTITFTIQHVAIDLPPALYVYSYSADIYAGSFTLNFGTLDPSLKDENFVTSEYKDYIIFDRNFMGVYYTEFSFSDNNYTISLYNTYHPDSDALIWPYIVGGVVGLILVGGIIVFCIRKRRNKRIRDQTQKNKGSNTALMAESKENDLNHESYHRRDYTTQNYGQESWISPDVPQSS